MQDDRHDVAASLLGRIVGKRYRLTEVLGLGASAMVFRAAQVADGPDVAVKVRHLKHGANRIAIARFRREAQVIRRLEHPGCVALLDLGHEGELQYTVMELLEADDLRIVMRRDGPMSQRRAAAIAAEICDVLVAAHALGIAHRDLKPANVMLRVQATPGAPDRVAVLDFGLAKLYRDALDADETAVEELTSPHALLGTPRYMAPEQVKHSDIDGRADLYALGVMLYEMLTGFRPIEGKNAATVMLHLLTEPGVPLVERLPNVHPMLNEIVERCLQKKPEDRHPSAVELLEDLRTVVDELSSREEPTVTQVMQEARAERASTEDVTKRMNERARQRSGADDAPESLAPETETAVAIKAATGAVASAGGVTMSASGLPRIYGASEEPTDAKKTAVYEQSAEMTLDVPTSDAPTQVTARVLADLEGDFVSVEIDDEAELEAAEEAEEEAVTKIARPMLPPDASQDDVDPPTRVARRRIRDGAQTDADEDDAPTRVAARAGEPGAVGKTLEMDPVDASPEPADTLQPNEADQTSSENLDLDYEENSTDKILLLVFLLVIVFAIVWLIVT